MPDPRRIYRILIVDDNDADLNLLREAFSECGQPCRLACVDSTDAAKRLFKTIPFDLVLSDMGADTDRVELIQFIRGDDIRKSLPVVVVSGMCDSRPAYQAGANAFISKTTDVDQFFAKIKSLMDFWIHTAELPF